VTGTQLDINRKQTPMNRAAASLTLALAITAGCSSQSSRLTDTNPPQGDTVRIAFQDGISPAPAYNGTRDALLKDGPIWEIRNGNFGTIASDTLGSVELPDTPYERRYIIKMDLSYVVGCLRVLEARLILRIDQGTTGALTLNAHEVVVPALITGSWPEGSGTLASGVSWHAVDGVTPWDTEGGDYLPEILDYVTVGTDTVATLSLPTDLVHEWIVQPASNHGLIIRASGTVDESYRLVHTREAAVPAYRPRLELEYLKSG